MSFRDIKGQDKTIHLLQECLRQSHVATAYLFLGPEGIGKSMIAKTLAKAINCLQGSTDSCDRCISCLKIEKNGHPDLHIIGSSINNDESSTDAIKIEDIRRLQKLINLKPYEGKKSVFIIDNAHNLTPEASGALLKTLEEPPKNSLIILISSKPALLFKTIISRCQIFKFSPLPRIGLEQMLKTDYSFDNNKAHFLSFFSEGRLGHALNLNNAGIFEEKNKIIDGFIRHQPDDLEGLFTKNRNSMRICMNILATWFRDIYLIKIGAPHSELINLDYKNQLLGLMNRYSFSDLDEALNYICESLLYLEQNVNIKLLLAYFMHLTKG